MCILCLQNARISSLCDDCVFYIRLVSRACLVSFDRPYQLHGHELAVGFTPQVVEPASDVHGFVREVVVAFELDQGLVVAAATETVEASEDFILGHLYKGLARAERLLGNEEPALIASNRWLGSV